MHCDVTLGIFTFQKLSYDVILHTRAPVAANVSAPYINIVGAMGDSGKRLLDVKATETQIDMSETKFKLSALDVGDVKNVSLWFGFCKRRVVKNTRKM